MRAMVLGGMCLFFSLVFSAVAASQTVHEIELADRVVRLSADEWRQLPAPEPFAVRFEARATRVNETFPQLLTIFKLPMQITDRVGVALRADELAEFSFMTPVKVTYRLRLDMDTFWVESVQVLEVPVGVPLRVPWRLNERASGDEAFVLLDTYDTEVKRTRFQLRQLF